MRVEEGGGRGQGVEEEEVDAVLEITTGMKLHNYISQMLLHKRQMFSGILLYYS